MNAINQLFGKSCDLELQLDTEPNRKTVVVKSGLPGVRAFVFSDGEDVCGIAKVHLKPGKKLEHQGIKVELIGRIEIMTDGTKKYDFFSISKDLEPPGSLFETREYRWNFNKVDKQNETYIGTNVRLRYFVRLSVMRSFLGPMKQDLDFVVQNLHHPLEDGNPIKIEVGIEDCLHIEFEYSKTNYHLKDVVIGKVYFKLVRIKIKHMELNVIRREICGSGSSQTSNNDTVANFEIMDGAPVKEECIPVRLYLGGNDLTPSYRNVQNNFSVKYFLNLVLVDAEDRRYFKQQELVLWRKKLG